MKGSLRVVVAAFGSNLGIALAKFIAASLSGSSAMLTEAIHSLVDTGNQILLLIGRTRGLRPADQSHPLGYGMEAYFWSFIVALMVFLLGGVMSIYEGVLHVRAPERITSVWVNFSVLAFAAALEGTSFLVGYREYKRLVGSRRTGIWDFIRGSKDPSIFSVLLEDGAALFGIVLAAAGIVGSVYLHIPWSDGAASISIGVLLLAVAFILANETRSLIAGEAVALPVLQKLRATINEDPGVAVVNDIATLHLGPGAILVALTLTFKTGVSSDAVAATINEITHALKQAEGRIAYVYVRPLPERECTSFQEHP
jgi:cation diffusion facilitator family transporter